MDHCEEDVQSDDAFYLLRDQKAGTLSGLPEFTKALRKAVFVCIKRSHSRRPQMSEVHIHCLRYISSGRILLGCWHGWSLHQSP